MSKTIVITPGDITKMMREGEDDGIIANCVGGGKMEKLMLEFGEKHGIDKESLAVIVDEVAIDMMMSIAKGILRIKDMAK